MPSCFWRKQLGIVGQKCIRVMLVPGSRVLVNTLTLTFNPNPYIKSEQGTNIALVHTNHSNLLILLNLSNLNHIYYDLNHTYYVRVTGHVMLTLSCFYSFESHPKEICSTCPERFQRTCAFRQVTWRSVNYLRTLRETSHCNNVLRSGSVINLLTCWLKTAHLHKSVRDLRTKYKQKSR